MHVDLAPDPSAVRTHLATVEGVACGTSLLFACGGAKDTPVLRLLVILPDSRVADRVPPWMIAPHGCRRCCAGAISGAQTGATAEGGHGIALT